MGTREATGLGLNIEEDHPHAYGDKLFAFLNSSKYLGSSPRVWGQVTIRVIDDPVYRIIPTRMGTSIK